MNTPATPERRASLDAVTAAALRACVSAERLRPYEWAAGDPGRALDLWFSPARATDRFGFAASTRSDGLAQLRKLGLVRTTLRTVSESGAYIDFARRRNVHEVVL